MITQWYDVPAETTEWEIRLSDAHNQGNGYDVDCHFMVFVDDPLAAEAREYDEFELLAGQQFDGDAVEWLESAAVSGEQAWRARYAGGAMHPEATGIVARIRKRAGRPLRIFLGVVSRVLPRDPCGRCRSLVKLAIRAARVVTGTLGPDDFIDMAEDAGFEVPQGISDFLDHAFGEGGIWDRIKQITRRLGKAFRWLDTLARKICEELGHCPRASASGP
ncbi:hypothetical protein [Erythrobacter mangrovi]|uniref:Uncharacterized protein n=1 Tax=Erythrobacter mangrovi TaxID=2739433 RepID=A0A7D4B8H3_9SPHN|nr:hypothetical protein [Erythrobacter mangrovi]QKG71883.1 hypothetical protein HQR01_11230 [Erythrobacter mangrovi]